MTGFHRAGDARHRDGNFAVFADHVLHGRAELDDVAHVRIVQLIQSNEDASWWFTHFLVNRLK